MTQVAVVTGAAGGIGAEVVSRLVSRGYTVHAVDKVAPASAPGVYPHEVDLTEEAAVEDVVARILEEGTPHLLVNAAGVLVPGEVLALSAEDWRRTFEVNLHGTVAMSVPLARSMVAAGGGRIVTIASNAAGTPRWGMSAYAASKAAVTMFTRCLGLELAGAGVRCNVVAPGSTDTPMLHALAHSNGADRSVAGDPGRFRLGIPLGRVATPRDIAEAVLFLASPAADQITMHTLTVDGGATLGG